MKNLMKFLGIAALAAVTSFSMIACDNGGGPGNNPGNDPQRVTYTGRNGSDTYTLVITENTSRAYTPVNGDTYKLTVTGGKTSTGTIVISGGTITLTPKGGTITVTVQGTTIVSITGTGLRWDDDTVFIAPGTLSNRTVGNPYLGKKLVLSGQVYVMKWSEDGNSYEEKFDGDLELSSLYNGGGIGEVKGGQLSFTIETPTDLRTSSEEFGSSSVNIKFSDDTVKIFTLVLGRGSDSSFPLLLKENITTNVVGNTASVTQERVEYVYVDGDVTLSGGGKFDLPDDIFDVDATLNDFSLPLKEGWNVICMKWEQSGTFTDFNITYSLGEPSGLKWTFYH